MPKQTPFWKRYEFLIVITLTLIVVYLIILLNQKINFILGNELIVYVKPPQKYFNMNYGNVSEILFNITIDNVPLCKTQCSFSFNDRSRNLVIDNGYFQIANNQHFSKSYNLSVKRLGSGQDLYSFEVRCNSIYSFLCLTKSKQTFRSSLISVNYDLTETERELKNMLKKNITVFLDLLSEVDILLQQLNQKYFELGFKLNLRDLSKDKIEIDHQYDKVIISTENIKSLWAVENYVKLDSLFNESFFKIMADIMSSITDIDKKIGEIAKLHNDLLLQLNQFQEKLNEITYVVNILDGDIIQGLNDTTKNFKLVSSSLVDNTFDTYEEVIKAINNLSNSYDLIVEKTKVNATILFFNLGYVLDYENNFLCNLINSCKENISIVKILNMSKEFVNIYPNTIEVGNTCNLLKQQENKYVEIKNETLSSNISFPSDIGFVNLVNVHRENLLREINNSYYDSFEAIIKENATNSDIIDIAHLILPKNKTTVTPLNYNQTINFSLYLLSNLSPLESTKGLLNKCNKIDKLQIDELTFDFKPVNTNITYKTIVRINTTISDNPPICCIFNNCKPCCMDDSCSNDPKTFPIIFIHGHSLAKGNSPEFSLDSFNKLQLKLQEEGFLNGGIISLYSKSESIEKGLWGLSGKPITVKVSYYYDAFRHDDKYTLVPTKSENIDTYAIRLKDLIDIVRERTNKTKVNIIAHSMGGLVARRYLQIFGDAHIDKLIMIATPNKGISGPISSYCKIIGESRECIDMHENSLFLNKLNDPLKQPKNVKLYNIIGKGCGMDLGDGDGIVLSKNAELDNAQVYYVNGTCGGLFGGLLHTDILDIDKYPKTYSIVKEILHG
ncbi:alpha/beta fold hydrolase [Candidatus Woesearchaeota archaeon]|nr:alpha/beta fold hydrolase [Candidatus Woesearchaeota archaeon]